MLRVLIRSVVLDIWENAVVVGAINALWIVLAFIAVLLWTGFGASAPNLGLALLAPLLAVLAAIAAPAGLFLDLLSRHDLPPPRDLLAEAARSFGSAFVFALGGLGGGSALALLFDTAGEIAPALAVAKLVLAVWLGLLVAQWFFFAAAMTSGATVSLLEPARRAAALVLARPVYCLVVLVLGVVFAATAVILLPGPGAASLLFRRAARMATDPREASRLANSLARRSLKSVVFPWRR